MKKSKIGLLLITLCLSTLLYAQGNYVPGYIITNQQDTVAGWINLRTDKNNQKQCEFKPDLKLPTEIYLPGDIAGYRFTDAGKYYVFREIQLNGTPQKVFLEFLVKGMMNLYYYEEDASDYYYFEDQEGKMEIISQKPDKIEKWLVYKDNRYIGQIRYLFRDYKPIVQEANNLKFDQKSMIKVVKDYHKEACTTGESCIVFQNEHPDNFGWRFKFSVYTGLQLSNYTFAVPYAAYTDLTDGIKRTETKYYTYGKSNVSPVLGAQVNMINPRWSKSFSTQLDVSFSQFKGNMPEKVIRYVSNNGRLVTPLVRAISYQALASSIRLGVKYTYPEHKISPTAEAGVAYTYLKEGDDILRHAYYGYYLAAGVDSKIKTSSHAVFIRLVYENYPFNDATQIYGDKISMPHLKIGYTF